MESSSSEINIKAIPEEFAAIGLSDSDDENDTAENGGGVDLCSRYARQQCSRCERPVGVCWCCHCPAEPISTKTKLFILQHPHEQKRPLMTAKILDLSLTPDSITTVIDKHFSTKRNPELSQILSDDQNENQKTLLLYPGPDATLLEEIDPTAGPYNVILLDGTWAQAKTMFLKSHCLHDLKRVSIQINRKSEYLVRTQPNSECLSTVESAAIVLAHLEQDQSLIDSLLTPLRALVSYQIDLGAKVHKNKEEAILEGTYHRKLSKKMVKHLESNKSIKSLLL